MMYRFIYYLVQPGVVSTGLWGTAAQVGLAFANTFNVAGAADTIAAYGLGGQLASGSLIAAIIGLVYSFTQRRTGKVVATGAGAVAGGISGTLGTAITQALGWTEVAAGTTPLLNFSAIWAALVNLVSTGDPSVPPGSEAMFDPMTLTTFFGSTAAGGGIGALIGRFMFGEKHGRGKRDRHAHAH
jgi:hypothetical protein